MRGGVLTGEQEGEDVADDLLVGEGRLGLLGREHRLEEVLRRLAQTGPGSHPLPGLLDELLDRSLDVDQRALKRTIGRQLHPAPVGDGRENAARQHVKYPLKVVL